MLPRLSQKQEDMYENKILEQEALKNKTEAKRPTNKELFGEDLKKLFLNYINQAKIIKNNSITNWRSI